MSNKKSRPTCTTGFISSVHLSPNQKKPKDKSIQYKERLVWKSYWCVGKKFVFLLYIKVTFWCEVVRQSTVLPLKFSHVPRWEGLLEGYCSQKYLGSSDFSNFQFQLVESEVHSLYITIIKYWFGCSYKLTPTALIKINGKHYKKNKLNTRNLHHQN